MLGITRLGEDIRSARDTAYKAIEKIRFGGIYYRKDIGYKAIGRK